MAHRKPVPVKVAPRVAVDPQIRFGQPVVKGTRVPIAVILDELAAGASPAEIAQEYGVSRLDIQAVLRYASRLVAGEDLLVAAR
jgi:uncharacterized protein (DUF433 family)